MQVVKQVISQTPVSICIDSLRGSCQNAVLGLSYSLAGSCLLRAGEPGTLGEAGSAPASMLAVGESGESARRGLTREFGRWASTLYIPRAAVRAAVPGIPGAAFGRCVLNTSPFTKFPLKKCTNANHASAL